MNLDGKKKGFNLSNEKCFKVNYWYVLSCHAFHSD